MKTTTASIIVPIPSRTRLGWRGALACLFAVCFTGATTPQLQAEEPAAFVNATFAEAQALAGKDNKLVFVDFFTTWCGPCKQLDATTWKDADVIALLRDKTVALRVDAEKERALAKQYRIDAYPTLLVLKPDGTEIDRYVGYQPPEAFLKTFNATLAGKTSLQAARDTVKADDAATPAKRMALARKLAQAGQNAEALELYLWCYDSGPAADPRFARTLDSSLPAQIGVLGRNYPPALEALRARRDPLREKVLVDPLVAKIEDVTRLAGLDLALKDDDSILATLAKLPADGSARKTYGGMPVLMRLVQKRHYREALSLGSPEEAYKDQADQMARAFEIMKASGRAGSEKMLDNAKKAPAMIGIVYVVMLAGAGETERARKLGEIVLAQTSDAEVRKALGEGLREAGASDLAAILGLIDKPAAKKM